MNALNTTGTSMDGPRDGISRDPVDPVPLPGDYQFVTHNCGGQGADPLADLLREPATYREIGVEFMLLIRVLAEGDKLVGDWDQIGELVATDGRTARRWAEKLEKAGRLTVTQSSLKTVELTVPGVRGAGQRPARPAASGRAPQSDAAPDADLERLVGLYRAAKTAGCPVRMEIVGMFGDVQAR